MKILIYKWKAYNYKDITEGFRQLGHDISTFEYHFENYDEDPTFEQMLTKRLSEETFDAIFTVNYFAAIANVCHNMHVDYIIWTCDNPLISLYHKSAFYPEVHIFSFDKANVLELRQMGMRAHHMPLCSNPHRIHTMFPYQMPHYRHEISFVGSLYERNTYDKLEPKLSDYLRGYFDGVIRAQINVSGGNIIEPMLTSDILAQLPEYFELKKSKDSLSNLELIFSTTVLGFKVAAQQRIEYLTSLARSHSLSLFSNSDAALIPGCRYLGSVDYWTQMPLIFQESKINLNMTIPNIKSGIPLRTWDVLASHGFLMTTFTAELLEYFVPDQDLVIFESLDELLDKADYYLKHDEKREQIAKNGFDKVLSLHPITNRLTRILEQFSLERVW
ncbi:CgeB family protein [Eubacterium oxidoreducens]|uniref:Spore maturation protein CgeB n=1 Tax=Eubacterium oxidoreducens TaxID=1732 RepID=A0A1G6BSG8_EUBOX|nr:DUF3880 domain-containing protein [Eubacterium oxidoreducens]SDB23571.1 spore maturation protein CgeB [Eubacterium oxidoreducens]